MKGEALKMALEALELLSQQPTDSALAYADNVINALRERLAQPAQEPVATLLRQSKQNYERNFGTSAAADWIYSDLLELLDTTPPQREPLTDEQIEDIAAKTMFPINFARAIEAAHGIKENT